MGTPVTIFTNNHLWSQCYFSHLTVIDCPALIDSINYNNITLLYHSINLGIPHNYTKNCHNNTIWPLQQKIFQSCLGSAHTAIKPPIQQQLIAIVWHYHIAITIKYWQLNNQQHQEIQIVALIKTITANNNNIWGFTIQIPIDIGIIYQYPHIIIKYSLIWTNHNNHQP